MPMVLHLSGPLNESVWQRALNTLFACHEVLRSVFVSIDGRPQVRLLTPDSGLPLSQHDLSGISDAGAVFERLSVEEACTPFDLSRGPLISLAAHSKIREFTCWMFTASRCHWG
ncbi:condensation domain-containing protein [Photorhabdus tasmaniensis]|uniref:Condensation domain-containing protein n=1 Tax=Photorhabdus tasmaniensis TaxID=1004159 RepID=A0ABX0GBZ7_9GAMM|nr:condensation domain-containing protein [Photorhabdus tasmaniensis]NHB86204.1 hypothetical protein [Photorhabdus tasmaniensis]